MNKPTLVLAHNKTLAGQLYSEFKEFFPENAVEYFVSYYDYYQPEAYIPTTDTYIEKDSAVNDEIDKLRHSATSALSERRDVIIVASVSCIYTLGDPIDYQSMVISLRTGMEKSRDDFIKKLVEMFPNLEFAYKYADEVIACNCGEAYGVDGNASFNFTEDDSDEAMALYIECWREEWDNFKKTENGWDWVD